MKQLIIIGASGHGKVIADIALKNGYKDIAYLDDNMTLKECAGFPVIGCSNSFIDYSDAEFIVGIGNSKIRETLQLKLEESGCNVVSLIHPGAIISRRVNIEAGSVVMAGAVINSDSYIGKGCIINTCASVDHDNVLDGFNHVSVGAHLSGTVHLKQHTWIGAGATVSNNVEICSDCMIGAGAVVLSNICASGVYVGVPAKQKVMRVI